MAYMYIDHISLNWISQPHPRQYIKQVGKIAVFITCDRIYHSSNKSDFESQSVFHCNVVVEKKHNSAQRTHERE